ncbi:hypothetical protein ASF04_25130 [Duganella sp. Leaf61]|uniref:hypothetical protein n=1 Tax=Duganella sp. Leaf61 TaxID=1736227 RepID=UPI0006FCA1AE|nr:hypothetical protein [Duganella sp. Leaf61]KQN76728.1 hypothetical protein ASF04_25130 [Duganella sp. Leaf61]
MITVTHLAPACVALAIGVLSAALYGRRRQWFNALLAVLAGAALAVALADARLPVPAPALTITTDASGAITDAQVQAIADAGSIDLAGDGLRAAQWQDLPARPLRWTPTKEEALSLDFPRTMALGRVFTLTVHRPQAQGAWRLQLLAENGQVLADSASSAANAPNAASAPSRSAGKSSQRSVQWLPPVAEAMVLHARVLDAAGKVVASGPVPVQVTAAVPLQIVGRFNAPSFDASALNRLLTDGGAVLDWQVVLGKAIARTETARTAIMAPNAMVVDAAHVEQLAPAARAALLAQVRQGVPLVVLGGNAADAGLWQRDLGLRVRPQSPTTEQEDQRRFALAGAELTLAPAALNPDDAPGGEWTTLARDSHARPWAWQRALGQGRVVWIGVADWHRYAISAPRALALWWQGAMDAMALAGESGAGWVLTDPMPLPGLRTEICARGAKPGAALHIDGLADTRLLPRADKADAVCAAVWAPQAGWVALRSEGLEAGRQYVYAPGDWPAWQRTLRREATAAYAARAVGTRAATSEANVNGTSDATNATNGTTNGTTNGAVNDRPLPAMPFAVLFALCLLALWWREQHGNPARPAPGRNAETDSGLPVAG